MQLVQSHSWVVQLDMIQSLLLLKGDAILTENLHYDKIPHQSKENEY